MKRVCRFAPPLYRAFPNGWCRVERNRSRDSALVYPCTETFMAARAAIPSVVDPSKKRVLIVDDEDFVRDGFAEVIGSLGVGVVLAADGSRALKELERGNLSLVILDLNLPGISGLRVLEWISQHAPDIPVLVVTGIDKPPNVLARFPNLVKIVEKKPISNEMLTHLVETYALGQ